MVTLIEKNTFLEVEGCEEEDEFTGNKHRRSVMSEPPSPGSEKPEAQRYSLTMDPVAYMESELSRSDEHIASRQVSSAGISDSSSKGSKNTTPRMMTEYLPVEVRGSKVLLKLEGNKWRATNKFLQAENTTGIYYRKSQNQDDRDTDTERVHWDTVLDNGFDDGDGWVRFDVAVKQETKDVTGLPKSVGRRRSSVMGQDYEKQKTVKQATPTEKLSPLEQLRRHYEQEQQLRAAAGLTAVEPLSDNSDSDGDEPAAEEKPDPDDTRTTLMVRDVDLGLSQAGFVQHFIDKGYAGCFNFVYMPMNFRNPGNSFGYAFINFTGNEVAHSVIVKLKSAECPPELQGWSATWSSSQGWNGNIERYRNSPLMHQLVPPECKPAVFDENGCKVPFPKPTKAIPKPRVQNNASVIRDSTASAASPQTQPPGLASAGYPVASTSPPTGSIGAGFGDAAPPEQQPKSRPGRSKRRQPRNKAPSGP